MPRKGKGGPKASADAKSDGPGTSFKEKGTKAFAAQNFDDALEYFSKAIEEDSKNHALYSNRAATYMAKKNYELALTDSIKCTDLDANWSKGWYRKGAALEALLRYPEAHQAYQQGLKVAPDDAPLIAASVELAKTLDELKITERELSQAGNPDADAFTSMVHWLRENGALFPKLYLQYYSEDYRGVHCLTKIGTDDPVLYVPFKCIMTSEVAKESDIGKKIVASNVDLRSKHSYLASYVIQEKHAKDSFWAPYINILPAKYANMPIFFDEELLGWLHGSMCMGKIADRIDSLRREYDNIRRAVAEFAMYTHEEFVWARLVVITRIFGIVVEGNKTDGLVPYADMLNHKRPREGSDTKWTFDDARYGFVITTLKTIPRGEQIFDSYGRKCNSRFFVNYGFCMDENEDNEAVIRLSLPDRDPQYQMKLRFMGGRESQTRREYQIPGNYREKKCKEFFSFLRFIHAQDAELMLFSHEGFKVEEIEPISLRNEIAVLNHAKKLCLAGLSQFKESFEHDQKLLASGELPAYSNVRNCVLQRAGEKEVLTWFVDLADRAIPFLQMSWKDLKKQAAKCSQGKTGFDFYVTLVVVPLVKRG